MAAMVSGGTLPRYICRLCGDLDLLPPPASVRSAPVANLAQLVAGPVEQVGLNLDVVVGRSGIAATGRQPPHQPATRYSDQFPLHATELPQLHCA